VRAYRLVTRLLSLALLALGLTMVFVTVALGGGPLATGVVLGVALATGGAVRLALAGGGG
jgi:hypothetical protein